MNTIKNIEEFTKLCEENDYIIADFYADWCGPCKMLGPVFEEVANSIDYAKLVKINVDENQELSTKYQVSSIPTIVFIKKNAIVHTNLGFISKDNLVQLIEKYK